MSANPLSTLVDRAVELSPGTWLPEVVGSLERGDRVDIGVAFAEAGRRVGRTRLAGTFPADPAEPVAILDHWSADDAARAALLLALANGRPAELPATIDDLWTTGDTREKAAIVRTLVLLPQPERFVRVALDCGRTHDLSLYSALACGNSFPALYYSEREFNAFAMKSVFVGVPASEILGLPRRLNPELSRMAIDYVDERESAGRSVPSSIWDLVGPQPPEGAVGRLIGYLNNSVSEHRVGSARALVRVGDARARSFLLERAAVESDPGVADVLKQAAQELTEA